MPFELEFEDTFDGNELDTARWLPYYLPHWSSRERSAARYVVGEGVLRLRIEEDQQPWCPELDGEVRGHRVVPLGNRLRRHLPSQVVKRSGSILRPGDGPGW